MGSPPIPTQQKRPDRATVPRLAHHVPSPRRLPPPPSDRSAALSAARRQSGHKPPPGAPAWEKVRSPVFVSRAERATKHAAADGSGPVLATRSLRVNQSRALIVVLVLLWLALLGAAWEGFRLARSEVRPPQPEPEPELNA